VGVGRGLVLPSSLVKIYCTSWSDLTAQANGDHLSVVTFIIFFSLVSSDGEVFISAHDLCNRKYEVGKQNFNVFNVKPTNIEDLKGLTLTCELWQSVLCDTHYSELSFDTCSFN
jgi:hypothetical protein